MAFWILIHVLILPIPKEKSLPFRRLKLTVISKNFRYTSYNFCICDTTRTAYSFCFASFQALNLNVPTVRINRPKVCGGWVPVLEINHAPNFSAFQCG